MLKEHYRFFRSVLIASDLGLIVAGGVAAYALRFHVLNDVIPPPESGPFTFAIHAIPLGFAAPIMLAAMIWVGQYRPRRDERFILEAGAVIKGVVVGLAAMIVVFSIFQNVLFRGQHYSGWQFILFGMCTAALLIAWRFSFRMALRAARAHGWNTRAVAIIGTGRLGQHVYHTLKRNTWTGITPVCFISHRKQRTGEDCMGLPVLSGLADMEEALKGAEITGVFVAVPGRMSARIAKIILSLQRFPLDVRIVPDMSPKYLPINMSASELDGMPLLSIRESPFNGWGGVLKRGIDIVGCVVLLAIFAVPMMIIGLLIYLWGGEGPVFYRQERMGLNGRRFRIFKFRTMNHAGTQQLEVQRADHGSDARTKAETRRITPIGRFLRRTSLDELPQLFNVILGHMSLVGPRPMAELIEGFRDEWRGCMLRQNVKPGITGWAQVNGLRGQTSLRKRLQYDLFYIRHWSLMFDLRILWMTLFRGFLHPQAS